MGTIIRSLMTAVLCCLCIAVAGEAVAGERNVIIGYHRGPGIQEETDVKGMGGNVKRSFRHLRSMAARMSDQAIDVLRHDPRVSYIEEDAVLASVVPVALSTEYQNAWGVDRIRAGASHAEGITGTGVKIAVLDTGIDYTHPEFAASYAGGVDLVNNDANPFDDSYNSHGTHVSGIISAARNDAGVVGVAPGASIYAVKVLDGSATGTLSSLLAGIDWAIANGMHIVNLSVETPSDFQSLREACDTAYQYGLLLVAAAGNSNGGQVWYPAAYPSVIAVSATDRDDSIATFAASGPEVELAAPGMGIYSTVVPDPSCAPDDPSCCSGEGYCYLSGTSQAAPHVTGVAALIISSGFALDLNGDGISDNRDVRMQLLITALDLGTSGPDPIYGYGLVQASISSPEHALTHIVVVKGKGKPAMSARAVILPAEAFEITIQNNSLAKMYVAVYQGESSVSKFSTVYRFCRNDSSRTFRVTAAESGHKVVFMPVGRTGAFADVFIRQLP